MEVILPLNESTATTTFIAKTSNYFYYLRRVIHIMFFLQFFIKLHTVPVLIMLRQNRLVIHRCTCFPGGQGIEHLVKQIPP